MVKYEVLFVDLPNPEASFASVEKNNELKGLKAMGITTKYELVDFEGKNILKMICSFNLLYPRSITKPAMDKVALALEQQTKCKVTYREI